MADRSSEGQGPHALSMHQPWASLLVYGIKRIEGRTWPTSIRGRIWIHATAQDPGERLIKEIEEQYRHVWALEGVEPKFPQHYPKSVLLGCVDLADCLPAESIEAWPEIPESVRAEVGSPFGFLCENPMRLVVPLNMRGSQKFWRIPKKTVRDIEPALRPAPQVGHEKWTWSAYPKPHAQQSLQPARGQGTAGRSGAQRGRGLKQQQPTFASMQLEGMKEQE